MEQQFLVGNPHYSYGDLYAVAISFLAHILILSGQFSACFSPLLHLRTTANQSIPRALSTPPAHRRTKSA